MEVVKLKYDEEVCRGMIEHGRVFPLREGGGLVKELKDGEVDDCERFVVKNLEFDSRVPFNLDFLSTVVEGYAPLESNCYHVRFEGRVLKIKFYYIPIRGD